MPPNDDSDDLRRKLTHAEAVIAELRGVVAELRTQIDAQQAHIHRLVKMTFGRGGERAKVPPCSTASTPNPIRRPRSLSNRLPKPRFPRGSGRGTVGGGSRRTCRVARR